MSKLLCFIVGHKYRLHRKITDDIREAKCIRCGKFFGIHDGLEVVLPLDTQLIKAHDELLKSYEVTNESK